MAKATTLESRFPEIIAALPEVIDAGVRAGAEGVMAEAKQRVPVRTGHLRDAIHVERRGQARYEIVGGDGEYWYGHLVEFGTNHSAPHAFLIPALEGQRDVVIEFVNAGLHKL